MFSLVFLMLRIVFNYVRYYVVFVLLLASVFDSSYSELCLRRSIMCNANCDSIIRVLNYVLLNPGLQRARLLWFKCLGGCLGGMLKL